MIFEKLNWKKLPLFFIAILFVPFVAFSVPEEVNPAKSSTVSDFVQTEEQKKVSKYITNAQSWYWLARATENSYEYYEHSEDAYDEAIKLAEELPLAEQEPYLSIAKSGKKQSEWRKDNAWDTVRSVFPAIWWLLDDDQTIEAHDDAFISALGNVWNSIEGGFSDIRVPMFFIYPRCENHDSCEGLRDELLGLINKNSHLYGIPDDEMASLLPSTWLSLRQGGDLSREDIEAVRAGLKTDRLVLIDIIVADEIEEPLPLVRVDLAAAIVSLASTDSTSLLNAGFAVSLVERRSLTIYWNIFLFLVSFIWMFLVVRIREPKDLHFPTQTGLVVLGFVLGIVLGLSAGKLSGEFAPDWANIALDPYGNFPRLYTLMWPLVHSAVIVLGPLILSAFMLLKLRDRLPERLQENISLVIFLPAIQAGGLATLFSPLIMAWPGEGLVISISISLAALVMSVVLASPLESTLGIKLNRVDNLPLLPLGLGVFGLIVLMPFGLFAPVQGIFSSIPMHIVMAGITLTLAAVVWKLTENENAKLDAVPTVVDDSENFSGEGSINNPGWVDRKSIDIGSLAETIQEPGFHCYLVSGERGIGKTRFISELADRLSVKDFVIARAFSERPSSNEKERSFEPFGLITKAIGPLLGFGDLGRLQTKKVQSQSAFGSLEGQLADLPGVGSLFGLVGDVDAEATSKSQVIRDVTRAIRKRSKSSQFAIVLDDLQWADESSIELLNELIRLLHEEEKELEHPVALILASRELNHEALTTIVEKIEDFESSAGTIELDSMDSDELKQFLQAVGLAKAPPSILEDIYGYLGTGNPLHWLEFLRGLLNSDQARVNDKGGLEILHCNADEWKKSIPPDLLAQVKARVESIQAEDILLLECAAQIGRKFSISELASGVSMDRLNVLSHLRRLEDTTSIVLDQDNDDNYFHIDSEVTRDVLLMRTLKSIGSDTRELVKEMHFLMAKKLISTSTNQVNQIFQHCLQAGPRMQSDALTYGVKAAESAAAKFAWPEVLTILDKTNNLIPAASPEQIDQLNFFRARAFRGVGGQDKREQAMDLALSLVESPHLDLFDVLYLYLETLFEEKQKDELEQFISKIGEWESEGLILTGLNESLVEFYRLLSEYELMGRDRDRITFRKNMDGLRILVENYSAETDLDNIKKMRLLSFIIQSIAIDYSFDHETALENESLIEDLFSKSEELKKKVNDRQGLAINLGSRGSYHLYTTGKISLARDFLSQDLELCDQMGYRGDMSALYNKLSMCDWIDAKECKNKEEKKELQNSALQKAEKAFRLAVELDREGDRAFAGFAVLEYARINSNWSLIDDVGKNLNDEELWQIVLSPYAKTRVFEECENLKGKGEWTWLEPLQSKVSTSMDK